MRTIAPNKERVPARGVPLPDLARTLQLASDIAANKAALAERSAPRNTGITYVFVLLGLFFMLAGLVAALSTAFTSNTFEPVTLGVVAVGALLVCSAPRPRNSTRESYNNQARELAQLSASLSQSGHKSTSPK